MISITIAWDRFTDRFSVFDDHGPANLPQLSDELLRALDAWKQLLNQNLIKNREILSGGSWVTSLAKREFAVLAGLLEEAIAKEIPEDVATVRVDPYPAVTTLRMYCDYSSWPLWDTYGLTHPSDFEMISPALRDELVLWCDPNGTKKVRLPHDQHLVDRLTAELGADFELEI